jgi:hypothetical protein
MVNIALGLFINAVTTPARRRLQMMGSALVIASVPLLLVAFLVEPAQASLDRPITRFGIISLFVGLMLHVPARQRA